MPGTGDGSSFYNAFDWDHTQYPGGTRVFGRTAQYSGGGINQYDWWAVTLEAGKTYAIQTRLPTAFNTYLYLYDDRYSYLLYDNDSGDDGYPLSKMVYNCTREAMYVISVGGSYYYYDNGPYVLECVPAPKGARTFVFSPERFDIRRKAELLHLSRFASIREKNFTAFGSRFTAFAPARNGNADRISARQVAAEYEPGAFRFGLWFGPTSPVDTSGAPDQIVPYYSGQGDYQAVRAQTGAEYVAVAAFTDDETGPVSELYLPWDTVAPVSPPDQFALDAIQ